MQHTIRHDAIGTHIEWELDGVTARQIDWFWSNMEKGFLLWHPQQHEPLTWAIPPRHGNPLGAVHIAPQTWNDGRRQNLYIRFETLSDVPPALRSMICHSHVMIVAGLGFDASALGTKTPMGYRLHQWSPSDAGVRGMSTAQAAAKAETKADGEIWAAHAAGEIANWAVFLPQLYALYKPLTDPARNPFADLRVRGQGLDAVYASLVD